MGENDGVLVITFEQLGTVLLLLLLLLLLKTVGSARLRESGIHLMSPKTPAPQYQPIDMQKEEKGKKSRRL